MATHLLPDSSTSDHLLLSGKPLQNVAGVELPGITADTQKVVHELLEKNHTNYDIFFNERGLHNHLVHHVLAAFSCGASSEVLKEIYEKHASYQRPKLPHKYNLTKENWTEHLGDNNMYTDYLDFFTAIINEDGMQKAFETYAFHDLMFPRLFTGAFHPIIHVGYALEFQMPVILAEGLAQVAVHENRLAELITKDYLAAEGSHEEKKIIDIINDVIKDKRFDDAVVHSDQRKINKIVDTKSDLLQEIAKKWTVKETEEDVKKAAHELFDLCVLAFGATAVRPGHAKIHLDFFLMHGLTSMLFVYIMLSYVDISKKVKLLKAQWITVLAQYIARGRPEMHVDLVLKYHPVKLDEKPNPWLDVIGKALLEEKEAHVIKVIRSLLKAQHEWGAGKEDLYLKVAQLTYDGYETYDWSEDIGFEEEWK